MQKFAVMGDPIAHSKSPEIHQAFAQQFNIHLTYERILVPVGKLAQALTNFQTAGGSGVNITAPLKQEAFHLVKEKSAAALQAGAVNTISILKNKILRGDNTDGVGLLRDLKINHAIHIQGKRLLILGAGGATRGILGPLLAEQPTKIIIANRTLANAQQLIQEYATSSLESCSLTTIPTMSFDLIINATASNIADEILKLSKNIMQDAVCYDLSYGETAKKFLASAAANGAIACFNGIGMLVEQAAEAFYLWHGKRPNTAGVIAQVCRSE